MALRACATLHGPELQTALKTVDLASVDSCLAWKEIWDVIDTDQKRVGIYRVLAFLSALDQSPRTRKRDKLKIEEEILETFWHRLPDQMDVLICVCHSLCFQPSRVLLLLPPELNVFNFRSLMHAWLQNWQSQRLLYF